MLEKTTIRPEQEGGLNENLPDPDDASSLSCCAGRGLTAEEEEAGRKEDMERL